MKVIELAEILLKGNGRREDDEVMIRVTSPGSVGSSPAVPVKAAGFGIDWDNGKFHLIPSGDLTWLTDEQLNAIVESWKKGQSWHAYQQYKKDKEEIDRLKAIIKAYEFQINGKGE